jgi:hypothetical protein
MKTQVSKMTEVPCLVWDGPNRIGVEETQIYWDGGETPALLITARDPDAPTHLDRGPGPVPRYARFFAGLDETPGRPDFSICLTLENARILATLLDRFATEGGE